jgi:2-hydroxy-6-oxonona-2,4-dienedioate hydrolase
MYPAGLRDISARRVVIANGQSLRVIESGHPDGDVVLMVHGWGGSVYSFSDTIPAVAAAGYRAIALDLPGHGLSDKPTDETSYATTALMDSVLGVANALRLRSFSYVGHSMGGLLGLGLALRAEERLDRLVLINAAGLGRVTAIGALRLISPAIVNRVTPALLTRAVIERILRFAFATKDRPTDRDIEEYWAPTQFPEFAWACRACVHKVDWRPFPEDALRSLGLPVLVIRADGDRVVGCDPGRGELIPRASVVDLEGGGHLVMQEHAARTNAEILGFLASNTYRG